MTKAARAIEPITMPAIAPPDSPFFTDEGDSVGFADAEGEDVGDDVGELVENVMKAVMVGRTTLAHLFSAPEL